MAGEGSEASLPFARAQTPGPGSVFDASARML